jgi:hypothetical protein
MSTRSVCHLPPCVNQRIDPPTKEARISIMKELKVKNKTNLFGGLELQLFGSYGILHLTELGWRKKNAWCLDWSVVAASFGLVAMLKIAINTYDEFVSSGFGIFFNIGRLGSKAGRTRLGSKNFLRSQPQRLVY